MVLAHVAGDAVTGAGLFAAAAASEGRAGLPGFRRSLRLRRPRREVSGFQAASFGRSSLEAVTLHVDVLLLANLVGAAQLGLYRAAVQLVNGARLPLQSIAVAVQSEYGRQWPAGDVAGVRRLCRRFTAASLALALAGYSLLAVFHGPVIRVVLGPDFQQAGGPLLFLLPGALAFAAVAALRVLPAAAGAAWAHTVYFSVFAAAIAPFALAALRPRRRTTGTA